MFSVTSSNRYVIVYFNQIACVMVYDIILKNVEVCTYWQDQTVDCSFDYLILKYILRLISIENDFVFYCGLLVDWFPPVASLTYMV